MNSKGVNPPEELSNRILNFVKADLDPSHKTVFSKLLGIQAFIGALAAPATPTTPPIAPENFESTL